MDEKKVKCALVHLGNDESYGLLYVAGELVEKGLQIKWFDGDRIDVAEKVLDWDPQFVFFSPLTTFFDHAVRISNAVKSKRNDIRCVFGGHHVSAVPECLEMEGVDVVVVGPVYGTIEKILQSSKKELIYGTPVSPDQMFPARKEYYAAIPRMASLPRKSLMSHFGCMFNCSYCSTSRLRKHYGSKVYKKFWLKRRPVKDLIKEAKVFLEYPTKEVELVDDDALMGSEPERWLEEFNVAWKKEIGLPLYGYVTPTSAVSVSDEALKALSDLVTCVTMGVQAARRESLKLFNRAFQSEKVIQNAYHRLQSFGIPTRLDLIIGLPVDDPVEDALESIKLAQRVGAGTCVICYPLMIYPGTKLHDWCKERNIAFNEECLMEWHTGVGSVKFDDKTNKKLKNIKKMATLFVKSNIEEHWMRALIEMDMTEDASRKLSECQYYDTIRFRLGNEGVADFDKVLAGIELKY